MTDSTALLLAITGVLIAAIVALGYLLEHREEPEAVEDEMAIVQPWDTADRREAAGQAWRDALADPAFVKALLGGEVDLAAGRFYVRDGAGGWKKGPKWPEDVLRYVDRPVLLPLARGDDSEPGMVIVGGGEPAEEVRRF